MSATIDDSFVKIRELADQIAARLEASDPTSKYEVIERSQDSELYINPAWVVIQKRQVPMPKLLRWLKSTRTVRREMVVVDRWRWNNEGLCSVWDRSTAEIAAASIKSVGALGGVIIYQ